MKLNLVSVIHPGLVAAISVTLSAGLSLASEWRPAVNIDPGGINIVNTPALEGCPIESPDGRTLFFASNRAGGQGGIDIWTASREGPNDAWGEPQNLPPSVNSAFDDFCPTPLPGGELYFVSRRPDGCGVNDSDIYFTRLRPVHGWLDPVHLGREVNSPGDEFAPSYVAAGGGMLFFSSNRDGLHKIYMSRRAHHGWFHFFGPRFPCFFFIFLNPPAQDAWFDSPTEITELSFPASNSARPNVSHDGRRIVFDSDRPGGSGGPDIWEATRRSVFHAWSLPANLGPNVNSASPETRPSLSRNGSRLLFGSSRPGGQGSSDIYLSGRESN